ncbi:hypothetical protein QZM25_28340 [Burkholderia contaminans]|uniref:hypothetical protein n=1 Tax=Burkholderia cepacia complex TaxID=87882 RepID=UPI001CF4624D|nr:MULTISPECIES: hypothetical protein [Burkholderia cepacia complex]MCA7888848.1 hypothetical protein [Burkholderia contaminans]MDN7576527.1 hypothetical protein [Burkholderia contaminans]MDN7670677.1 hypothetical protein [Burkholderia vietnamiensis]
MSSLAAHSIADTIPTMPAGLAHDHQQELAALAVSLRGHFTSLEQTAVQIALITFRLNEIIVDASQAQAYFCQVTGKSASTYRTYRVIGRTVAKHFTHPEGHIPYHIARLPLDAFHLLDENTDPRVVEAIDEQAQNGPLTAGQVKKLVETATAAIRGDLEEANARIVELSATTAEAQAHAKDAENERTRAESKHDNVVVQLRAQEEMNRELQADRTAVLNDLREAHEEVERLRNATTQVQYVDKHVEVLPKDVESLEQVQAQLATATARAETLKRELADLDAKLGETREASNNLDELDQSVNGLLSLFPSAMIIRMRDSNPAVRAKIDSIADQLRAFADALTLQAAA